MTGTSMDLSVEAMVTTTELPYESVLVSKYQDGQERRHNISGTYQETLLTNVQVVEVIRSFFLIICRFLELHIEPLDSKLLH